jgi:predicted CXXCH cytochrome family protein
MKLIGWVKDRAGGLFARVQERLKEPLTFKAKLMILSLLVVIIGGSGFVAYSFYDFTQNNPKFCVGCHLMEPAFESWEKSEHAGVNCHECHHLSVPEMNQLLISFIFHRPTQVPERHAKVIVGSKYCNQCHTEGEAKRINRSLFHAKHVYMEQIECTACHGDVGSDKQGLHRFNPTEKFCTKCHENKVVHGEGMGGLACLNCHTDRTKDLKPGRKKCLYCHGSDDSIRNELISDGSMDVRFFTPDPATVKRATKIVITDKSPMQFYCYECHKPHTPGKVRPKTTDCLGCHAGVRKASTHRVHLNMDMQCKDCHRPHVWTVTEASAKKDCVQCHEYRSPKAFL